MITFILKNKEIDEPYEIQSNGKKLYMGEKTIIRHYVSSDNIYELIIRDLFRNSGNPYMMTSVLTQWSLRHLDTDQKFNGSSSPNHGDYFLESKSWQDQIKSKIGKFVLQ